MEEKKKMKVAMICHFSNAEVRDSLPLSEGKALNFMLRLFKQKPFKYGDFAPWVNSIAANCFKYHELEMHVIAPHFGLKVKRFDFEKGGVYYHFIKNRPNYLFQGFDRRLFRSKLVRYRKNYQIINRIVTEIDPTLVVLVGAENPDYSGSVLDIKKKPIFLMCQTVFDNPEFESFYEKGSYQKRKALEKRIMAFTPYLGCYSDKHYNLLKQRTVNSYIFRFNWPNLPKKFSVVSSEKEYDFINFANSMSFQKGYHDSIQALAIVKKQYPNVKMVLIDNGPQTTKVELEKMIDDLGLIENVKFVPFFEHQQDLFQFLESVRFAVLPCKVDYISGTMLQSMRQGIPIVVYETEGTVTLNSDRRCALIAKQNDVEGLAHHMISLMSDNTLAKELSESGKSYMEAYRENNERSMDDIVNIFKEITEHYYNGAVINSDHLFG